VPLCQLLQHCFAIASVTAAFLCHCVSYCNIFVPLCQLLQHCCAIASVIAALLCHCVSYCSIVVPLRQLLQHFCAIASVTAALLCHCVSYCSIVVPLRQLLQHCCAINTSRMHVGYRQTDCSKISKERHEMCQAVEEGVLRLHGEERRKERQPQTDGRIVAACLPTVGMWSEVTLTHASAMLHSAGSLCTKSLTAVGGGGDVLNRFCRYLVTLMGRSC
jgi:hypothetical protein